MMSSKIVSPILILCILNEISAFVHHPEFFEKKSEKNEDIRKNQIVKKWLKKMSVENILKQCKNIENMIKICKKHQIYANYMENLYSNVLNNNTFNIDNWSSLLTDLLEAMESCLAVKDHLDAHQLPRLMEIVLKEILNRINIIRKYTAEFLQAKNNCISDGYIFSHSASKPLIQALRGSSYDAPVTCDESAKFGKCISEKMYTDEQIQELLKKDLTPPLMNCFAKG